MPFRLCRTEAAGLGLVWRDEGSRKRRSSARAPGPARAWGESWGDRPRGDFVRWVPKVAPPCELRAAEPGVLGPLTALNGFVGVGVSARVEAAMVGWSDRSEELEYASSDSRQHWRSRNGQDCAGLLLISEAAWGGDRGGADLCCDARRCRRAPARVQVSATDTRDGRGRMGEPASQLNNGITRSPCAVQSETERAGWSKRQLAPGERRTSVEGLSHSTQCSMQRTAACKGKGGMGVGEGSVWGGGGGGAGLAWW